MDILNSFLSAFLTLTTTHHFFYLIGGVLLGMTIGVLPGLGGIVGFSIMLPFIYGMDPTSALALLIGLVAVIPTSDTFASVLLGIPGSSSSQATVQDGFPLSKQGQAARALGSAFSASLLGGIFGALILTLCILFARPLVLLFGSAELFMLGVLGISMVGVLSSKSILKGLVACCLGLALGSLGNAPATGEWRMAFESAYLYDGLRLVIIGLAAFALPEVVELLRKNTAIASRTLLGSGWLRGIKDTWMYRWIVLRCASLGVLIGALPGLGGSVVDWIAYGHVVQTSRDKSKFGKGDIRGVIAPESANNAKEGGGLVPTLLFAIPGSGSMAVFLGGLTILGIEAGPTMITQNLDITYIIIWSLALANVFGAILSIGLSAPMARITAIPYGYMAPVLLMIICFASFQATKSFWDLIVLLVLGTYCMYMKRFDWSRPALLIGFVLADTLETYLYQAVQFYSWGFLARPGVIIIFLFTLISVLLGTSVLRRRVHAKFSELPDKKQRKSSQRKWRLQFNFSPQMRPQILFTFLTLLFFIFALFDSISHSFLGAVFPTLVCVVGLISSSALLAQKIFVPSGAFTDSEWEWQKQDNYDRFGSYKAIGWFYVLTLLTGMLGFFLAMIIIFTGLLATKTSGSWPFRILVLVLCMGGVSTLAYFMNMDFPWGVLQSQVRLPWPLG